MNKETTSCTSSLLSSSHHSSLWEEDNNEDIATDREESDLDQSCHSILSKSSRVSFGGVRVRQHRVTVGDHPGVSAGVPIGLDWERECSETFTTLEEYETRRQEQGTKPTSATGGRSTRRTSRRHIRTLSVEDRDSYLREMGHTDESLEAIVKDVIDIKECRRQAKYNPETLTDMEEYLLIRNVSLRQPRTVAKQSVPAPKEVSTPKSRFFPKSSRVGSLFRRGSINPNK